MTEPFETVDELEEARGELLAEFPDLAEFADLMVGNDRDELANVASELQSRLTARDESNFGQPTVAKGSSAERSQAIAAGDFNAWANAALGSAEAEHVAAEPSAEAKAHGEADEETARERIAKEKAWRDAGDTQSRFSAFI